MRRDSVTFAYFTDGDEELGQLNDYAARLLQTCLYELVPGVSAPSGPNGEAR